MSSLVTRRATPDDVDPICDQRARIFLEAGRPAQLVARLADTTRAWHAQRLADGRYRGWLTEVEGEAVAGVGLIFLDWAPGASHPDADRRGLVLNLYVDPGHRGRGLAKSLLRQVEVEAMAEGVTYLVLHATDQGRPLYEAMDWRPTTEMSKTLRAAA